MKKNTLFLTFVPWIVFSAGLTNFFYSALIALVLSIVISRNELLKGYVLDIASVIFFAFMAILAKVLNADNFILAHPNLLSNAAITAIMFGSVIINKPFTGQYTEMGSLKFHRHLSLIWSGLLLCATLLSLAHIYFHLSNTIGTIGTIVAVVLGIKASEEYPQFYFDQLAKKEKEKTKDCPFLKNNFAPVKQQITEDNLTITGEIPSELSGVYMRNGPNPEFEPISYTYPLDGDGMIHAVYIKEGKASYRNRYVETKGLLAERRAGKAIYGGISFPIPVNEKYLEKDDSRDPIKDGAFIHIIRYAQHYLAMYEAGPAYEVTRDLDTVGEWAPINAEKPFPINAHARFDSRTNEVYAITYDLIAPYLRYYVLNKEGELTQNKVVEKPYSTMMHDFVLTENYVVFFDGPAVFHAEALTGRGPVLTWEPERGVRIGLIHRKTNQATWIQTEAFFVYHFANAFEKDNTIIVTYVRHEKFALKNTTNTMDPMLYRAVINLKNNTVSHEQLYDELVEFPRIRESSNSFENQFIYLASKPRHRHSDRFTTLVKYDAEKNAVTTHDFGDSADISEAVFIPKQNSITEDDGYLGLFVYDQQDKKSDFVILNAQTMSDEPVARIHIPQRVPNGLHGSWMMD